MLYKKAGLENFAIFTGKHPCYILFLITLPAFRSPIQVFSSEYCEMFQNTYFEEHMQTAASGLFEARFKRFNINFRLQMVIF